VTQYTTRRAWREAERKGLVSQVSTAPAEQPSVELGNLTRRQMKEMGIFDDPTKLKSIVSSPAATRSDSPETVPPQQIAEIQPRVVEVPVFDVPSTDFTSQNLISEPTSASIVLERAPEAISIPIDTAEIAITGSIAVVTDPITSPNATNFDGLEIDQISLSDDAVTGVMSVVEPISALDLIEQRADDGVVPSAVLRKGWWKPWAIGIGSLLLAAAAAFAILLILNAVGAN